MIKGIFFDVDGTLVSVRNKFITDRLRDDLLALRRKGVKLFICTGRARQDLASTGMLRGAQFDAYVTLNGQCCFDSRGLYRDNPIPREDLERAAALLRSDSRYAALMEADGASRVNRVNARVREVFQFLHTEIYPVQGPEWMLREKIYQFVPLVRPEEEGPFLAAMPHCVSTRWHPKGLDILPAGEGKAAGIRATMERYGLEPGEIMAFGDGENDASMLSMAGTSVAMGNSVERILAIADHVTGTVEEDGISQALRRFGLLGKED